MEAAVAAAGACAGRVWDGDGERRGCLCRRAGGGFDGDGRGAGSDGNANDKPITKCDGYTDGN